MRQPPSSTRAATLVPYTARFRAGGGADVRASHVGTGREGGSLISAELGGRTLTFSVGMAGAHWVNNALAVIAAVDALGGDLAAAGLADRKSTRLNSSH